MTAQNNKIIKSIFKESIFVNAVKESLSFVVIKWMILRLRNLFLTLITAGKFWLKEGLFAAVLKKIPYILEKLDIICENSRILSGIASICSIPGRIFSLSFIDRLTRDNRTEKVSRSKKTYAQKQVNKIFLLWSRISGLLGNMAFFRGSKFIAESLLDCPGKMFVFIFTLLAINAALAYLFYRYIPLSRLIVKLAFLSLLVAVISETSAWQQIKNSSYFLRLFKVILKRTKLKCRLQILSYYKRRYPSI